MGLDLERGKAVAKDFDFLTRLGSVLAPSSNPNLHERPTMLSCYLESVLESPTEREEGPWKQFQFHYQNVVFMRSALRFWQ